MSFVSNATDESEVNIYKNIRTPTPAAGSPARRLSELERDVRQLTARSHDACEEHADARQREWMSRAGAPLIDGWCRHNAGNSEGARSHCKTTGGVSASRVCKF